MAIQRPAVIKKSERHDASEQRVRKASAKATTLDAPSGYPFAGPSALCAAAKLNVTQSMILNTFMVPNSLSEVDPTRSNVETQVLSLPLVFVPGLRVCSILWPYCDGTSIVNLTMTRSDGKWICLC